MTGTSYHDFVLAVQRVEARLRKVTKALNDAEIPYGVIGGNAVAAWVARIDPAATRTTKDVDVLVDQTDIDRVSSTLCDLGFLRVDEHRFVTFVDPEEPSARSVVRLVLAGERVRPEYNTPAPSVEESEIDPQGYRVVSLPALVRMKLTSNRRIDQVHIEDPLRVGLIDDALRATLPRDLSERLAAIEAEL